MYLLMILWVGSWAGLSWGGAHLSSTWCQQCSLIGLSPIGLSAGGAWSQTSSLTAQGSQLWCLNLSLRQLSPCTLSASKSPPGLVHKVVALQEADRGSCEVSLLRPRPRSHIKSPYPIVPTRHRASPGSRVGEIDSWWEEMQRTYFHI